MTLHEAIEKLLRQKGKPMTTSEIAFEINRNGWYQKKDGSAIDAFQVHGRTKNYSNLFDRDGSMVSLIGQTKKKAKLVSTNDSKTEKLKLNANSANTKKSFDPISDQSTEILILGTMPGDKSIELNEYYAYLRNRFWRIISAITNNDLPQNYSDKKRLLLNTKIGIWDVAYRAVRRGSLDSAIKSEEPNDLNDFIENHKSLKVIGFNGKKSEILFDKYFDRKSTIKYFSLPSSSPANTGIDFDHICNSWRHILV